MEVIQGFATSTSTSTWVGSTMKLVIETESASLRDMIARVIALSNLARDIKNACCTSFLYHHLDILSPIIGSIYEQVYLGSNQR
jgi:hypothetical protein